MASAWTVGPPEAMMEQATWIADRDLAVAGSLTVSSGPRVVMMADSSLPTLTRTSVWLEAVPNNSLITQDSVGSTKSRNIGPPVSAMRARA